MKKLEEQESSVNVACPMQDEASWVITCKGDHKEKITQFDCETGEDDHLRDFHFLSNVDSVKITRRI